MKIIVGLGNIGSKYQKNRHNLGFMIVDELVKDLTKGKELLTWETQDKFQAEVLRVDNIILVKPQTMMNMSGMAIAKLVNFYKVNLEDLIVIYDDLDLKLGKVKIRQGGSAAGHHGVESVINQLGSDKFIRLRVGIGNDQSHSGEHKRIHFSAERFVIENFLPQERSQVKRMIKRAVEGINILIDQGLEVAQNQFN